MVPLSIVIIGIVIIGLGSTPSDAQSAGSCVGILSQEVAGEVVLEYQRDGNKMYCEGLDSDVKSVILKSCYIRKMCEGLGIFEEIGDNGTDLLIRAVFKARQID